MALTGIGGGRAGLQYDFTKLTNQQILDTSKELLGEGKINNDEAVELALYASGGDYVPIDGNSPSVASVLNDRTQRNLLGILSEWSAANHSRAPFKGEEITDTLLTDLSGLQAGGADAVAAAVKNTAVNYKDAFTANYSQGVGRAMLRRIA